MATPVQQAYDALKKEIGKVVIGQEDVVEELLIALASGGHVLLEGVPGLAKTLLAKSLAFCLDITYTRIQFTPDLMPSDILGTNVFDMASHSFTVKKGPIFTDVLLADEINRTPPKTQAALLEAMEERQVTIDGVRHPLPEGFFVIATQNPLEYEGTYPLPEAQIDRFLMKIRIGYPNAAEEMRILSQHHEGFNPVQITQAGLRKVLDRENVKRLKSAVLKTRVEESVLRYIVTIVGRTRQSAHLTLGASPRAAVSLLATAKGFAALEGVEFVTPDHVKRMAGPVLRHRLMVKPETEIEGMNTDQVIDEILAEVDVPR